MKNKTHLTGTLRSNIDKVPGVTDAKLKRGEIVGKENAEGIVIGKRKDKRDVTMLSTRHGVDMIDTGKNNKNKENIVKPEIIIRCNNGKAGMIYLINFQVTERRSENQSDGTTKSLRKFY